MERLFQGKSGGGLFEKELTEIQNLDEPPLKFEHDTRDELLQQIWGSLGQRQQRKLVEGFSPNNSITLLESFPFTDQLLALTHAVLLDQNSLTDLINYYKGLSKINMPVETYERVAKRHLLAWRIAAFEASWYDALD